MGTLLQIHWTGRFGNRMHQYAYGATYAELTGSQYLLPSAWEGTRLFANQPHSVVTQADLRVALADPTDGSIGDSRKMDVVRRHYPDAEMLSVDDTDDPYVTAEHTLCFHNLCATTAVTERMSRRRLQELFSFSPTVKRLRSYRRYSAVAGTYDVAHLRRGDVANPDVNRTRVAQPYSVISMNSYRRAFAKFGYSADSIEWISDDDTGRWVRRSGRKFGWGYPVGSGHLPGEMFDWLTDFLRLYFARTIFRGNSSFSWWAATLSPTARVFSPVLTQRSVYGVDGQVEVDEDFVEGNSPHWAYDNFKVRTPLTIGE
jgi:hypothetical protein